MESLWQDFRFALRTLRKNPGFALVAVLTLALGIGANTAIFSVVYGVVFRPLIYPEAEQLVWFWDTQPGLATAPFSAADFLDLRDLNKTFEHVAGVRSLSFTLTGHGAAARLRGYVVTPNFFSMLRIQPARGRDFAASDAVAGAPRVAILTHESWQQRFGGDENILGLSLVLNEEPVTVIGVLPPVVRNRFVELYLNPRRVVPEVFPQYRGDLLTNRGMHYLGVMGRLKPGVTLEQAQADVGGIVARIQEPNPPAARHGIHLISYYQYVVGDMRKTLLILLASVGFVLLIACANVANLLLTRASGRQREMAIRSALGAGRGRMLRLVLTESLLLALAGGVAGVLLAYWGVDVLVAANPAQLPRLSDIRVDGAVLGYALGISLLTGLLFGLAPALHASGTRVSESLKEGGRGSSAGRGRLLQRNLLVVSEVALSLVLLAGAGLLLRSFANLLRVEPGFQPQGMMTFGLSFSSSKYRENTTLAEFVRRLDERLRALPGVTGVAIANDLPLEGQDTTGTPFIEGRTAEGREELDLVGQHVVNPGYFAAMGIPLKSGREFTARDVSGAPSVAIINEQMATHFWPGTNPIGKRFRLFGSDSNDWTEVVGIVGNVKHNGLQSEPTLDAYAPYAQRSWSSVRVAVRSPQPPASLASTLRLAVQELDADLPVTSVRTMDQVMAESVASRQLTLSLAGLLATLALALASVGIYGVMSFTVAQRTHEIGIRMALGAQRTEILRLVLSYGLGLTLFGVIAGVAASLGLVRFLQNQLFGVATTDAATFVVVPLVLVGVALAACCVPAWRAARVDPITALRYE